jgi:hypothetical protein
MTRTSITWAWNTVTLVLRYGMHMRPPSPPRVWGVSAPPPSCSPAVEDPQLPVDGGPGDAVAVVVEQDTLVLQDKDDDGGSGQDRTGRDQVGSVGVAIVLDIVSCRPCLGPT